MEPQYLLVQQIQQTAAAIEQNLRYAYDPQLPAEHKQIVVHYLYAQNRQIKDLVDQLFSQFRTLETYY